MKTASARRTGHPQTVASLSSPESPAGPTRIDTEQVRESLERCAEKLRAVGVAVPPMKGKLLRPVLALALAPRALRRRLDDRFWFGALAIQMAHEASLLHDDIIDDAAERRGEETMVAARGVGPALVLGDHYLTGAYRAAAATGSGAFIRHFIVAVERTVAGEIQQARAVGSVMDRHAYHDVVVGKSGELFGVAAVLAPLLLGLDDIDSRAEVGREIGAMYQRVDDLLDYCDRADTGKAPFQDYAQRKWTWVMDLAGIEDFDLEAEDLRWAVFGRRSRAASAASRALRELDDLRDELTEWVADLVPGDVDCRHLLEAWCSVARAGVEAEPVPLARPGRASTAPRPAPTSSEAVVAGLAAELGGPDEWSDYFGHHARTFSLAARLFPAEEAERVAGLYTYCRFTDDIVDEPFDGAGRGVVAERLEAWRELSLHAFQGSPTGIPLLDHVLGTAACYGVQWKYPEALLDGVEMDLTVVRYRSWAGLERYTFGVAGAVGGWMTQMFGIDDEETLDRAHSLGHGMQLTNILRDVGEDLDRDRVYLPQCLLDRHGVSIDDLQRVRHSDAPLPTGYSEALEELIAVAEAYYEHAGPGFSALPKYFRRPSVAASAAYRGIHREVRRNGYDNLRHRAHVSTRRKVWLALGGTVATLWRNRG